MEQSQKKNSNLLLILSSLVFVASLIFFIYQKKGNAPTTTKKLPNFSAQVIPVSNGYGYQILADTSIIIKQETIPGRVGVNGFMTEEEAKKTADLVIHKLKNGIFPPGISEDELHELGIK